MKQLNKLFYLWVVGGSTYYLLEILHRRYSHWTMFILGGICFVLIGLINETKKKQLPLILQALIGAVIVTALEFVAGCILNLWLHWDIWDYSNEPFNLLGQICLKYFLIWIPLAMLAIILDDYIRFKKYKEPNPWK